jgi:hypothetical protein
MNERKGPGTTCRHPASRSPQPTPLRIGKGLQVKNSEQHAFIILAFPAILSVWILLIPVVPDTADHALASRVVEQTARWYSGHLLAAVAFGIRILSVHAIEATLGSISYRLPNFISVLMGGGAGLYAAGLGADGIGPVAAAASTSDPPLFFDDSALESVRSRTIYRENLCLWSPT